MRRRNLVNLVLLAAAAGLGALAWWGPPGGSGPIGKRLTTVAPGDVHALVIEFPDPEDNGAGERSVTLERRHDGWHLTRPIERPARDGRIVTALGVLATASESCYAVDEHDPAEFGLAPPRLRVRAGETSVTFGDRSADGRRYVRAGERMCLLEDRGYPLLAQGLDGLAAPSLLTAGGEPLRIETPWATASRADVGSPWHLNGGAPPAERKLDDWSARWLGAQAQNFLLDPPSGDYGRIRIETADAEVYQWRIAQSAPELVLVPSGANYGIRVAAARGKALLRPFDDAAADLPADAPEG